MEMGGSNDQIRITDLLKRSQQNAGITSWEYNATNRMLSWVDPSGNFLTRTIDSNQLVTTRDLFGEILVEDVPSVNGAFHSCINNGNAVVEYRTKNETDQHYYKAFFKSETSRNRSDKNYSGTIQNITEFKQAENYLRHINEAFQQSEELANLGNWQINLITGDYNYSGNLFKIFGAEENQFFPVLESFYKFVHPEDKEKIFTSDEMIHHADAPHHSKFRIVTPAGEVKHIKSISKSIQNHKGERIILGTIQDVTREETLMKHLCEKATLNEMIFENSIDYVSAFDNNLNVTAWNRKCEEKTGLLRKDVLGKHVLEVFRGDAGQAMLRDLNEALKEKTIHREETSDNDSFYDMSISPITSSEGLIFGVLCISHDLTFIKNVTNKLVELNHSLKHKNDQLEQFNSELASFSYVASHDLQEPLRKIQTFSSRIMEKEYHLLSPQGTEYFKRMDMAARRMQTLIDDLLTFSRTNTQPRNFKISDLNQILEEVKYEIRDTIEEKKAIIISDKLPTANVINFQFHQLMENLLLNALKYNKPGVAPEITITCTNHVSAFDGAEPNLLKGAYYKIYFKDNGIGFDQKYHQRIFELFQRLHGKSEYPGTGLGLAICKRIMQNHKGAITAKGEPGVGATFSIYLPV